MGVALSVTREGFGTCASDAGRSAHEDSDGKVGGREGCVRSACGEKSWHGRDERELSAELLQTRNFSNRALCMMVHKLKSAGSQGE